MNVAPRSCVHRRIAAFAGVALVFAFGHVANAAPVGCSQDVLKIDGVPVAVGLCAIKRDPKSIAVTETFTTKTQSFAHETTIDVLLSEESSRGIDDVSLEPLGIAKHLHITMHVKAGTIVLEHALLLPGAVPLK
jgi:hypothetical protein